MSKQWIVIPLGYFGTLDWDNRAVTYGREAAEALALEKARLLRRDVRIFEAAFDVVFPTPPPTIVRLT